MQVERREEEGWCTQKILEVIRKCTYFHRLQFDGKSFFPDERQQIIQAMNQQTHWEDSTDHFIRQTRREPILFVFS
jgi:hypothetical protein